MQTIGVFCGSNAGKGKVYRQMAVDLGHALAMQGYTLVYGGGRVGLMGILADAVLEKGGRVIGVIPHFLAEKEVGHPNCTEMIITQSMHERKATMERLADAFIAMPGGIGTFEELFEIFTWAQLGLHAKAIGLLNVQGYYKHLLALLQHSVEQQFLSQSNYNMLLHADNPTDLLAQLKAYTAPPVAQWLQRTRT